MPVAFGNVSVAKCLLEVGLEGGAWRASYSGKAKVVRTVCHNHRAVLNVLEEQSEELQYWRKVSFVVEDLVGRAVRGEGWRFQGQQPRISVTNCTKYTNKWPQKQPLQS